MIPSLAHATLFLAHRAIATVAIERARELGIDLSPDDEQAFRNALLSPVRAAMIRGEWRENPPGWGEAEGTEMKLGKKYGCSQGTVHSIVIGRR